MASPVGTLSSCSTQRDHWNGGDRDDLRSGCRSITPTRHTRRASSRSTCQSGGSTDCSRRAAEDAESIRHHEKPTRNTEGLSRIRVGVRVRPAFSSEVLSGYRPAVTVSNVTTAVQRACEDRKYLREEGNGSIENGFEHEATGTSLKQACVELKMSNWRRRRFSFDYAFDAACQQDEIYQRYVILATAVRTRVDFSQPSSSTVESEATKWHYRKHSLSNTTLFLLFIARCEINKRKWKR